MADVCCGGAGLRSRLSKLKLTCLPSSCRPAGKRLHGCAAGCASCNNSNMPGTVQLPEQLLCHPAKQLKGRLCSSANNFMQTYAHHLLLHEVNLHALQLHVFVASDASAAMVYPMELPFTVTQLYAASHCATITLF